MRAEISTGLETMLPRGTVRHDCNDMFLWMIADSTCMTHGVSYWLMTTELHRT